MAKFKAILTVTWEFESDQTPQERLDYIKAESKKIVDKKNSNAELLNFSVRADIASMKDRKARGHLAEIPIEEVFANLTDSDERKEFIVNGESFMVRMNSDRLHLFKKCRSCVVCGLTGTKMMLDTTPSDEIIAHFNMYAEEDDKLVLMTKDHILAKSRGGPNSLENYRTMCSVCNNLRGNDNFTIEQIRELREAMKNQDMLSIKRLRQKLKDMKTTYSSETIVSS